MPTVCTHLKLIKDLPPVATGCVECLATGGEWMHLRLCLTCGNVGCCDDSPNRHARKHAASSGHVVIQSFEDGEDWVWCFVDDVFWESRGDVPR